MDVFGVVDYLCYFEIDIDVVECDVVEDVEVMLFFEKV